MIIGLDTLKKKHSNFDYMVYTILARLCNPARVYSRMRLDDIPVIRNELAEYEIILPFIANDYYKYYNQDNMHSRTGSNYRILKMFNNKALHDAIIDQNKSISNVLSYFRIQEQRQLLHRLIQDYDAEMDPTKERIGNASDINVTPNVYEVDDDSDREDKKWDEKSEDVMIEGPYGKLNPCQLLLGYNLKTLSFNVSTRETLLNGDNIRKLYFYNLMELGIYKQFYITPVYPRWVDNNEWEKYNTMITVTKMNNYSWFDNDEMMNVIINRRDSLCLKLCISKVHKLEQKENEKEKDNEKEMDDNVIETKENDEKSKDNKQEISLKIKSENLNDNDDDDIDNNGNDKHWINMKWEDCGEMGLIQPIINFSWMLKGVNRENHNIEAHVIVVKQNDKKDREEVIVNDKQIYVLKEDTVPSSGIFRINLIDGKEFGTLEFLYK